MLVNLEKLAFHKNCFFYYFKWNSGGLGVSRRTAPTIRCYLQSFSRFGGAWYQKVHFSTFDGKLTFQCSRNGLQNPPFCPGFLQDTFIIYSSISHQHIFRKSFAKTTNLENQKSENLNNRSWKVKVSSFVSEPDFPIFEICVSCKYFSKIMLVRYRGINNKGVLERPWTIWRVLMAISSTLRF